jgi:hypothetical protein
MSLKNSNDTIGNRDSVHGTVFNAYQGGVGLYENCKPTNPRLMAIICVALFWPFNGLIFIPHLS